MSGWQVRVYLWLPISGPALALFLLPWRSRSRASLTSMAVIFLAMPSLLPALIVNVTLSNSVYACYKAIFSLPCRNPSIYSQRIFLTWVLTRWKCLIGDQEYNSKKDGLAECFVRPLLIGLQVDMINVLLICVLSNRGL